jgi:hypothetical protein
VYPRDPFTKYIPDPIEIGHVETIELPNYFGSDPSEPTMQLEMKTLSTDPKVFVIENFISRTLSPICFPILNTDLFFFR